MAHEISHLAAFTKDFSYYWSGCEWLARFQPDIAVGNAQNEALYVMHADPSTVPYEPVPRVDIKHGDTITLQASNGKYLGNVCSSSGNYIQAPYDNPQAVNCYFRVENAPYTDTFYLARTSDMSYLIDNGYYLSLGGKSPNRDGGYCFKFGEFTYHDNEKYLVLQSTKTGKLLALKDDWYQSIVTDHPFIDQWTLFKVAKV